MGSSADGSAPVRLQNKHIW